MLAVAASELLRQENFQRFSKYLPGTVTEGLFRGGVEANDTLIFIDRNDGIGCDIDEARKQCCLVPSIGKLKLRIVVDRLFIRPGRRGLQFTQLTPQ